MMKNFTILSIFSIIMSLGIFSAKAQQYCIPSGNCTWAAPIMDFSTTGGLINISNLGTACSQGSYQFFSNKILKTKFGDNVKFTITSAGVWTKGFAIWVDWNSDGDFDDTGEAVWNSGSPVTNTITDSLTIPTNIPSGIRRMRVRSNYGSVPTSPCASQTYGECEDYVLNIISSGGLDLSVESIESPVVFGVGNNSLKIALRNNGYDTIYSFKIGYKLGTSTPVTANYTLPNPLLAGDLLTYTFLTPISISTPGSYDLKVWCYQPNLTQPDSISSNDTLIYNFHTGLSGNYSIGTSGDFSSFSNAVSALHSYGVSGACVFNVANGTYNEKITINEIVGANSTNTIKFKGTGYSVAILKYSPSGSDRSVVHLNGADYITFEKLTIENSYNSLGCGVWLSNEAQYNNIINCNIKSSSLNSNFYGILGSTSSTSLSGGNNTSYLLVDGCIFIGGRTAVAIAGTSSIITQYNKVKNCTITDMYSDALAFSYCRKMLVQYNQINNMKAASANCMYFNWCYASKIDGNILEPYTTGIKFYLENYLTSYDSSTITNNIIGNFTNTADQTGILSSNDYNLRILHNTIEVDGSTSSNATFAAISMSNPKFPIIKNNILSSIGNTLLISINWASPNAIINFNQYYYSVLSSPKFYNNTTYYSNLNAFKLADYGIAYPHDLQSKDNLKPTFVSSTDFHLASTYKGENGQYLGITTDVDGDLRCIYNATIGADESTFSTGKPNSQFYSDDSVCFGTPITFVNAAPASATQGYKWYIDNSFQSSDLHFTHTFPSGIYTAVVSLITSNCEGADTFSKTIYVGTPPNKPDAAFISDKNIVNPFYDVQLYDMSSGCPSDWEWRITPDYISDPSIGYISTYSYMNFTTKKSQNPIVRFDYPGVYDICLKVSNINGDDSICITGYLIVKPIQNMCEYMFPEIQKADNGLLYDDGGPTDYANNVNCDLLLTPCSDTITFTFYEFQFSPGDYLRVYDGIDNTGTPLWNTTVYGTQGMTGDMTNSAFNTTITATSGYMYFQLQTNSSGQNRGFYGEWLSNVGSYPKPNALFTSPDTACMNVPITFVNQSTGTGLTYIWDFEGNNFIQSTAEHGEYTYLTPGNYNVRLIVESCGGADTFYKLIVIEVPLNAPTVDFVADNVAPLKMLETVTFTEMSTGCIDNWTWNITPSSFTVVSGYPNKRDIQIVFYDTGCYTVSLIGGYQNAKDTIVKNCYINPIDYCFPSVTNLTSDLGISRVKLGSIDNLSPSGSKAYTDYANLFSTYLDVYAKYGIQIERPTNFNSIDRKYWIDWNIDGDFTDPGEEVGHQSNSGAKVWIDSFSVPSNAKIGATRMRVGTTIGGSANTPCGKNLYGEYEDYRVVVRPYSIPPEITLNGNDTVYLNQCDGSYVDAGATAYSGLFGSIPVVTTNNLDHTFPGTYIFSYFAQDTLGNSSTKNRYIIVLAENIAPALSLKGNVIDTVEVNTTYSDPGYIAYDTCSGMDRVNVYGKVKTTYLGLRELAYTAYDNNGNTSAAIRKVWVLDRTKPQIQILGATVDSINVFDSYTDLGATVSDNYDKVINYSLSGSVNTNVVGVYTIKYTATDSVGNGPVVVSRVVYVIDTIKPTFTSNYKDGDTLYMDVFDFLPNIISSVSDNYDNNPTITTSGTYKTNFPTEQATEIGFYTITYSIKDSENNHVELNLIVKVSDTQKPKITLKGTSVLNICRYDLADTNDLQITVTDNYDPAPTVWVNGSYYSDYYINRGVGFFSIFYHAKDVSGNLADSVVRYVNVQECPDGIFEDENDLVAKIYPNPNQGVFILEIKDKTISSFTSTIYNSLGEILMFNTFDALGNQVFEYNLNELAAGIYYLKLNSESATIIKRIVINH